MLNCIFAIVFGLLGLCFIVLMELEQSLRNKKELFKANVCLGAMKIICIIELIVILCALFL